MSVRYVDVFDQQDVGQRVDNFLLRQLKGVPRQHIYRLLRKGEVRINGGRVKASYRLTLNDRIRIPPVRTADTLPVQYSTKTQQNLTDAILFEDEQYLVIDKPSGIAVHGGSGIGAGVVEILRDMTGNLRLELVHRLDRDTSGCLALAKNRQALSYAQQQFRDRQVKKIYEVFVAGAWPQQFRTVQLKLQRFETSWGERRVKVSSDGRASRTDFAVLDRAANRATRLQATLHTGRTHQIRVHTSANGHPVLGDDKYTQASSEQTTPDAAPRLCLHARKLMIPLERGALKVNAPVSAALEAYWVGLKGLETA